ncbi:hypothetical protein ASPFODRAFT_258380 [Aspergillus luchuensis CBS 106.47]|uniref:Guanylate kinase-like domain-containing protein n=1 Tax=Aspergillus luchuensis (strain CBS 106.47) TaxID=1137211 RepID=A0A1M3U019_ASPLC|nr:hypothetical protein ASPFODRAFT_258380 [Aspergillus luchuensis CBS 106.47]
MPPTPPPPQSATQLTDNLPAPPPDPRPIVIYPSGVGEDTLFKKLFDLHPDTFAFTVSHTTRAPRVGEIHGKSYFFIDKPMFEDLISQSASVEHAHLRWEPVWHE